MQTILLAEDELVLGKLIKEALERKSFEVLWARNGQEAYDLYCAHRPALCVLDIMMPVSNGFVVAANIRALSKDVPILFLTARSETDDVIRGFEAGGNDYMKKPFSLEEFQLRVQELLRRNQQPSATPAVVAMENFVLGIYQFSPVSQVLKCDKETIKLSFKESELLNALISYKNTLMPRKEILMQLWGDDSFFHSRTMDVYIGKLRRYLKHDTNLSIVNIRGFGFKLIEEAGKLN
ncbi:response regulator transcription factor [Taibaiella chishuiensis]|uniref:DNA-binding response OmpR family regulator n=1 Tax=Taibaiella chishuiensis TaxID=1434707 RepID=A0A2P8D804_9BACT|nr:response regulator transcription factor [Taibaiella chishuiensis]PSK93327.1 DNA-binding response OmpR family regulator [Taibaiella chishuiensis]